MTPWKAGILAIGLAAGALVPAAVCRGQAAPGSNHMYVDTTRPSETPETGFLDMGGTSSAGRDLAVNSRYIAIDGKPWLPVMGEFHFSRYPESDWETEILKMKAGGVQIISTYVFWIHHEEIEGRFDWTGQRDLRRFAQICAKNGMYLYLRIGPWAHGEARNGGFPDWLIQKRIPMRQNDPEYLGYVDKFFSEIGRQVDGLLWKDGGPVIGAQLENEYDTHGPLGGAAHIEKLRQMAVKDGIVVPIYSVTGWPSRDFPPREVLPVLGGYPDGFWDGSRKDQRPSQVYLFNLRRSSGAMGAIAGTSATGTINMLHYPYFEAEAGAGMETSYHRRPLIRPDDIAALTLTGIGSGVNLYGYYMFQGGANPVGAKSTLQESQATGYPNDLPVVSYDYQAPLGEFGQVRESYRKTKNMHLFLNAFGYYLAPMAAAQPTVVPKNAADTTVPRISVRSKDGSGFLFVNNYVRQLPMPARGQFQVAVRQADGESKLPRKPIAVPADTYFIWPFNLPIGDSTLRYSTAQLLTKVEVPGTTTYFFFAIPGISPEFLFDSGNTRSVAANRGDVAAIAEGIDATNLRPGMNSLLDVTAATGKKARIVLLTEAEAENLWLLDVQGQQHVVLSGADVYSAGTHLVLRSRNPQDMRFLIYPAAGAANRQGASLARKSDGVWTECADSIPPVSIAHAWKLLKKAGSAPAPRFGPSVAWRKGPVPLAPEDDAFDNAAVWQLTVPKQPLPNVAEIYLHLDYAGDIGRMYLGPKLLDDNFYNGTPWEIGLERFLPALFGQPAKIEILPLRRDSPIYLDREAWRRIPDQGSIADIKSATLQPEYEDDITLR